MEEKENGFIEYYESLSPEEQAEQDKIIGRGMMKAVVLGIGGLILVNWLVNKLYKK